MQKRRGGAGTHSTVRGKCTTARPAQPFVGVDEKEENGGEETKTAHGGLLEHSTHNRRREKENDREQESDQKQEDSEEEENYLRAEEDVVNNVQDAYPPPGKFSLNMKLWTPASNQRMFLIHQELGKTSI